MGFRRAGFSPALSLLMSAFALPIPPADLTVHLRRRTERSSTDENWGQSRLFVRLDLPLLGSWPKIDSDPNFHPAASVHGLSPVKSSAQADSTSELLRFL